MNCRIITSLFALISVLVLSGCDKGDGPAAEETVLFGPQFSSKDGLLLPEETRQSLGVKVVEVTEQKVPRTVQFQVRLYKTASVGALATGNVRPDHLKQLTVGQSVELRTQEGRHFSGKIAAVNADLPQVNTSEVLVEIPTADLAVGTFLDATVTLDAGEAAVAVPRSALLQSIGGYSVYTVNGEHFLRTPVEIGASNADLVEIKDGLYAGDNVVTQPVMALWMTELAAVNGGQACCAVPAKGK